MHHVSFWEIFKLIGTLAEKLNKAAQDGKISITEALDIVDSLCGELGIDFDTEAFNVSEIEDKVQEIKNRIVSKVSEIGR